MAVADLGVAIGPRIRRRLTKGGTALVVIAAIVAALTFLNRPPTHGGAGASGRSGQQSRFDSLNINEIVFGMSPAQVLRLIGPPTTRPGRCWQYPANVKLQGARIDATRVCFFGGHVSDMYEHLLTSDRPPTWSPRLAQLTRP